MYNLDVNFLNDRPEYRLDSARFQPTPYGEAAGNRPLWLGALVGLLLPLLALGGWLFLQIRNGDLERQQAELESKVGNLQTLQNRTAAINAEVAAVKGETQSLASVFNQVKPLSALMQDLRDRTPPQVQVLQVKQIAAPSPAAPVPASPNPQTSPPPSPTPKTFYQVAGLANSFDDVNDLLLLLQKSSLLDPTETRIISSELADAQAVQPFQFQNAQQSLGNAKPPNLPRQVKFEIQTALTEVPSSQLLQELERKGATGLVTRIEALQEKGVIQP
ncbi:MAG TPA: PilN domain-containing protein [Coleofasciculaceae cyanobacterium]